MARTIILFSAFLNFGYAFSKLVGGYIGHSDALIADGIESSGDILASLMLYFGVLYAQRPADENHPYGHGKAETLVTFFVVVMLVMSSIFIGMHAIEGLYAPDQKPEIYTLWIITFIVISKEALYRVIKYYGKKLRSDILIVEAKHHRSDAISSLFAFVGILIALFFGKGFEKADDIAALVAAVFIFYNAYKIFRPALGEIMDEHLYPELEAQIRTSSIEVHGIHEIEKCHIRKHGNFYQIDLHAEVDGNMSVYEGHALSHDLKDYLLKKFPEINHVLVHIEPKNI